MRARLESCSIAQCRVGLANSPQPQRGQDRCEATRACGASFSIPTRAELEADFFIMATDADAVFFDWGKPTAKAFRRTSPQAIREYDFPAGSICPKVDAACRSAEMTGKKAAIGALKDLPTILRGEAGTTITTTASRIDWAP
jgi:hypothetical protein